MKTTSLYKQQKPRGMKVMILLVLLTLFFSCEEFITVDPPKSQVVSSTAFNNDKIATSVITGIYSRMMSSLGFASGFTSSITVLAGLYADELVTSTPNNLFFNNALTPSDLIVRTYFWHEPYQYIYSANSVLEGIAASNDLSASVKTQLEGEAKFIRAFCYFYLVNFFGDVPLHIHTDYRFNSKTSRVTSTLVYDQIISDLTNAQDLLRDDYSISNGQRTRPNKWAAKALLSRVYLYTDKWGEAERNATDVIANSVMFNMQTNLNDVFLKNSNETIWQLMPSLPGFNTMEGFRFIPLATPPEAEMISSQLLNAFEAGDYRSFVWMDSISNGSNIWYYPHKYKVKGGNGEPLTEYSVVLRLAEQYLIRAEARARQGDIQGSRSDLNIIRSRTGLEASVASTKEELLLAIERERQVELFTEWGHRWLDLKRTNRATDVLSPVKSSNWQNTDILFPIPQQERDTNPFITQNEGY